MRSSFFSVVVCMAGPAPSEEDITLRGVCVCDGEERWLVGWVKAAAYYLSSFPAKSERCEVLGRRTPLI